MNPLEEERLQDQRRHDINLSIGHLFEREEATARLVLSRLYEMGCANAIDRQFPCRFLRGSLKSVAQLSKPIFLPLALYWFKTRCPLLVTDYLCSLVAFDSTNSSPVKTEVEVLPELQASHQEIKRLRGKVRVLTGVLVATIALASGGFAWLIYQENLGLFQGDRLTLKGELGMGNSESENW